MNTYTLDQAGVASWQHDLYHSSQHEQALERAYVQSDFEGWLTERFGADQRQLDYLSTLGEDFVHLLRDELVLSLREQLPITFDRQRQTQAARSGDSVKVTEIEKWLERRKEGEEEEEPMDPTTRGMPGQKSRDKSRFVVRTYYRQPSLR